MRRSSRLLLGFLALLLALGVEACGGDSNAICDKIYGECNGAFIDDQGGSISREACVRYFDKLAIDEADYVFHVAECIKNKACDDLSKYFERGVSCP